MRLQIFEIYWDAGGYGSGLCIVAANTSEEATNLAENDGWRVDWEMGARVIKGAYFEGEPQVLASEHYQE